MGKATISYRDGESVKSSERLLSKSELRKIFGSKKTISIAIIYRRRRFKRHKEFGSRKTEKKERFLKREYPKLRQKARIINL